MLSLVLTVVAGLSPSRSLATGTKSVLGYGFHVGESTPQLAFRPDEIHTGWSLRGTEHQIVGPPFALDTLRPSSQTYLSMFWPANTQPTPYFDGLNDSKLLNSSSFPPFGTMITGLADNNINRFGSRFAHLDVHDEVQPMINTHFSNLRPQRSPPKGHIVFSTTF